jgi:hypothetical protein
MLASRHALINAGRSWAGVKMHENQTTGSYRVGMVRGKVIPGTNASPCLPISDGFLSIPIFKIFHPGVLAPIADAYSLGIMG